MMINMLSKPQRVKEKVCSQYTAVGPGGYCYRLSYHGMPFRARNQGSDCVSMTRWAIAAWLYAEGEIAEFKATATKACGRA